MEPTQILCCADIVKKAVKWLRETDMALDPEEHLALFEATQVIFQQAEILTDLSERLLLKDSMVFQSQETEVD